MSEGAPEGAHADPVRADADRKIFCIGLSRTATLSLARALGELGITAKHYPNDATTQAELRRGQYELSILEHVQALLDIPVSPYYAQFDGIFPDARFILTTRPTESWLASMETHFRMYLEQMRDDFDDFVLASVYGALHFNADRFRYVKDLHERNVREYFSGRADRLLVFDVFAGDSWPQLCTFLDRPLPKTPFPHRNAALSEPARPPRATLTRKLRRALGRSWPGVRGTHRA